jgi:hypothetical protein
MESKAKEGGFLTPCQDSIRRDPKGRCLSIYYRESGIPKTTTGYIATGTTK